MASRIGGLARAVGADYEVQALVERDPCILVAHEVLKDYLLDGRGKRPLLLGRHLLKRSGQVTRNVPKPDSILGMWYKSGRKTGHGFATVNASEVEFEIATPLDAITNTLES